MMINALTIICRGVGSVTSANCVILIQDAVTKPGVPPNAGERSGNTLFTLFFYRLSIGPWSDMMGIKTQLIENTANARGSARRSFRLAVEAFGPSQDCVPAMIHNLSETGLLLEVEAPMAVGDVITVDLPHCGLRPAEIVWARDGMFGCRLQRPISKAALSAAELLAPFGTDPLPLAAGLTSHAEPELPLARPLVPGELSLPSKVAVIAGMSFACWAGILGAAALFA